MHWRDRTRDYLASDPINDNEPQRPSGWRLWIPITAIVALLIMLFGGRCECAELPFWTFDTLGAPCLVSIDSVYVAMGDSTSAGRETTITSYIVRGYEYIAETGASWDTACVSYRAFSDSALVGFISVGSWCPPDTNKAWAETSYVVAITAIRDTLIAHRDTFKADTNIAWGDTNTATWLTKADTTACQSKGDTNNVWFTIGAVRDTLIAHADTFKADSAYIKGSQVIVTPEILAMSTSEFTLYTGSAMLDDIEIYRATSDSIVYTVLGATATDTLDLTPYTPIFTARKNASDTTAVLVDTLIKVDATAGKMALVLTADETAIDARTYRADIRLVKDSTHIRTVWYGRFKVMQNVGGTR